MDGHAGNIFVPELDLSSMEPGTHINAQHAQRLTDGERALDPPARTVEASEESVACRVDL